MTVTRKKEGHYETVDSKSGKALPTTIDSNFLFNVAWPQTMTSQDLETIECYVLMHVIQNTISRELRNTVYLGPFRQAPLRRYPFRGSSPNEVGAQGEATVSLLASENLQKRKRLHIAQIGKWLGVMGLAKLVRVERVGKSDLFDVGITLADDVELPIADLGYGVSQILPVLTQCSFAKTGATLLFEQPELHLHQGAARKLARVFTDTIKEKGVHIVAETHSPELFYEVFQELRDGRIKVSEIAAYEVVRDGGSSRYTEIKIFEEDGSFEADHPWAKRL
jgi:hypothetical protein